MKPSFLALPQRPPLIVRGRVSSRSNTATSTTGPGTQLACLPSKKLSLDDAENHEAPRSQMHAARTAHVYGSSRIRLPLLHPPPHLIQPNLPSTGPTQLPPHHVYTLTHRPIQYPKPRALPSPSPNPPLPPCPPTKPALSPFVYLMLFQQLYGCNQQPDRQSTRLNSS